MTAGRVEYLLKRFKFINMKFILGKKLEMTQKFMEDGTVVPVTAILAGPCTVTQIRSVEKDGYSAVQIGFLGKSKLNKSESGHLKDLGKFRYLREFRVDNFDKKEGLKRGDEINVDNFEVGDVIKVSGNSKGKGFQGVVRRYGFSGSPASHGHKDQLRMPGSIGATGPARVFKGKKMPGHMGDRRITVKNLKVVEINKDKNIMFIKGAVPGARNGLVEIVSP
jgi:large subunit ribosomal protein L3